MATEAKKTKMELGLTKEQRLVAHAAATEQSRPILVSVCVRGNRLIAANGFIMAETKIGDNSTHEGDDVLIPAAEVLKTKDMKHTGNALFVKTNDKVKILDANSERLIPTIDGTFPDTDHLYPEGDTKPVFRIALSYDVLSKLVKIIGKDNYIKLEFYRSELIFKYEVPNNQIKGLGMPFCARWED